MEPLPGDRSAMPPDPGIAQYAASKPVKLELLIPGFDPTLVRCAAECRMRDLIGKDEGLSARMKELLQESDEGRVQYRLKLMTNGYRVDEVITHKLFKLGTMLTRVLRLALPLDIFVVSDAERNAFCLPSRKGNRLVMCLHSGLVNALSQQELLFCMGHEVGHALLKHSDTPNLSFDNPNFSPLEVVRVRALGRAQEISCDRFGLLACQDVRVASQAIFQIATGLNENWICFDENVYARTFDELSSMAEVVDLEDATRTHPFDSLRAKAMIAFSKSVIFAKAFGKTTATVPNAEMEKSIEAMLSVLDPDLSELENAKEEEEANRFLINGALMVITAEGNADPQKVAWLKSNFETEWSPEEITQQMSKSGYRDYIHQELKSSAHVLKHKLPELRRARLLHAMCDVAICGGELPDSEIEVLNRLRQLLDIRPEIAEDVLETSKKERAEAGSGDSGPSTAKTEDRPFSFLDYILAQAKLPQGPLQEANKVCDEIRADDLSPTLAARWLVAWAMNASGSGGPLTENQGKKIVVSAIKVCREMQGVAGQLRRSKSNPMDSQVREFGIVAMFRRGEKVKWDQGEEKIYVVVSVSRSRGSLVIAPEDDLESGQEVEPGELTKDLLEGEWPPELTGL